MHVRSAAAARDAAAMRPSTGRERTAMSGIGTKRGVNESSSVVGRGKLSVEGSLVDLIYDRRPAYLALWSTFPARI